MRKSDWMSDVCASDLKSRGTEVVVYVARKIALGALRQIAQDRAIGQIVVDAFGDQLVERGDHRLHRRDLIAQPPDMSGGDRHYVGAHPPPLPPERKQFLDLHYQKAEVDQKRTRLNSHNQS